jgi:hypothetical protein
MLITAEDIIKMPAGREMDALVAEMIFGWSGLTWVRSSGHGRKYSKPSKYPLFAMVPDDTPAYYKSRKIPPRYSTNINASLDIAETMGIIPKLSNGIYCAEKYENGGAVVSINAKSEALAICQVALLIALKGKLDKDNP